jgi:energy-coupling factor transporter ATP-binding protein EcfA2
MNPSQAIKVAREILEGDFALHYFTSEHLNLMQRLEESILSPKSEVVLLQGSPGCGITTLLSRLEALHPTVTELLKGDVYIGNWDFVDHLCDALNVRRGNYSRKNLPPYLFRVLSIIKCKAILIDDLDIYIANEGEVDQVFRTIRALSSGVPGLTFVLSTRNERLANLYFKYAQPNWWSHGIRQRISVEEYRDIENRLWDGLNENHSLDVVKISLESFKPSYGLDIQSVNRTLRLHFVECFLLQQGVLEILSDFNDLEEYESYVQSMFSS